MRKLCFLLLLLVSIFGFSQNVKQYIKSGKEFAENGNYTEAIKQYTKAIEIDSQNPEAYKYRAIAYEKSGSFQLAFDNWSKIVIVDPDEEVYYNLGRLAFLLGKYTLSIDNLNKALNLKSSYIEAYLCKIESLLALKKYNEAQKVCEDAINVKETAEVFYLTGLTKEKLDELEAAELSYMQALEEDKKHEKSLVALSDLLIRLEKYANSNKYIDQALKLNPNNIDALIVHSKMLVKTLDYPGAINDISKCILLSPNNERLFFIRGSYYQQFNQYQNAINDFAQSIGANSKYFEAYFQRAISNEKIGNAKNAIADYEVVVKNTDSIVEYKQMYAESQKRLFELNRESELPSVSITNSIAKHKDTIETPLNSKELTIKGCVVDQSKLEVLQINGKAIQFVRVEGRNDFLAQVNIESSKIITITATDAYQNTQIVKFQIKRTEIDTPTIVITSPYTTENGDLLVETKEPTIFIEGKVNDASPINSITIDGLSASFQVGQLNPTFSANVSIKNNNKIKLTAIDVYGNKTEKLFNLNKDVDQADSNNPMGKTWIVFIENSNYKSFASLDGPVKDVALMKTVLAKYNVSNIIHKKDLSKADLERFFSVELRDMVRGNRVGSLMIWYAGHGKFINNTGYWIPVDANRDDEFSYFNINTLRSSLQNYISLTHTLVVTDACESGPTFYQAMRAEASEKDCSNYEAIKYKSSQVLSNSGYELAAGNSKFTQSFANALANNASSCIPIESIVNKMSQSNDEATKSKPQFGKIAGLTDENGTFFFIAK